MEGGDLWRGGDEGVSYGPRGRPRANGWGCRAGKLQRALESPAPNPLSSALGLNRGSCNARPGKDGRDRRSHGAVAKPARSGPAAPALDKSPKNAFPQLYNV